MQSNKTISMSKIVHLKLVGKTANFLLNKKEINCTPSTAAKPCLPEDQFDQLESCKVCGKMF